MPSEKITESKKRKTNPGVYISGGAVEQSAYDNTDLRTLMQDFTDMRNGDCIASTSVDILITPIMNSNFKVQAGTLQDKDEPTPLAKEAADYVAWIYDNLVCGLDNYIRHKLLALYYGFAMFERVWARGREWNGKVTNALIDLSPIQPDTIHRFLFDDKAVFTGVEMYNRVPEHGERTLTIDSQWLHVWSPMAEFGNILGRSLLRPARNLYKIKKQIWTASGRAASRGAGIPEFIITPTNNKTNDEALKSKLQTIARGVGNSENSYVISQKDLVEFKLHTLTNQEMNLGLIEQANREMWYNTMSHFVTSGIGENGSRAATGEHKGPYFEALMAFTRMFENDEYENIKAIIDNSPYFGRLDPSEMPQVNLERSKDADLNQVFQAFSLIKKTPEDEQFIREVLGLPVVSLEELEEQEEEKEAIHEQISGGENAVQDNPAEKAEEVKPEEKAEAVEEKVEEEEPTEAKAEPCPHCIELQAEEPITAIAEPEDIFELKAASESLATAEEKAKVIIEDVLNKAIEDAAYRLGQNPNKQEIKLGYKRELIDRLESVFNTVFEYGNKDMAKEYAKISKTELKVGPIQVSSSAGKLEAKVETLYTALENAIKDELKLVNKENIANNGGMEKYIMERFGGTQKAIQSDLVAIASGGYLAGRNDTIVDIMNRDPELRMRYETSLEGREKICEVCRPLGGMSLDKEQATYLGLVWKSGPPVNPLCLGGVNCRCTWVPTYSMPVVSKNTASREYNLASDSEGTWVTINGAHVLIGSDNYNEIVFKNSYNGEKLPENFYVHGRSNSQKLSDTDVVLVTQDIGEADRYAHNGSVWGLIPEKDAITVDMTKDKNRKNIISDLFSDYKSGNLTSDQSSWLEGKTEIDFYDGLNPKDIVKSAEFWDNRDLVSWYSNKYDTDFVKTDDGGVFINHYAAKKYKIKDKTKEKK